MSVPTPRAAATPPTLGYGEFYGVIEREHRLAHFEIGLLAPGEPGWWARPHHHASTHLMYVAAGEYIVSCGARERVAPEGSLLFVPAGTTHRNRPATPATRILGISIAAAQVEEARSHVRLPDAERTFRRIGAVVLARRLARECNAWDESSPLTAAGLCLELLGGLDAGTQRDERLAPRWLRAARDLLHDRCCDAIRIAEVAAAVGVHPIHLSRTFRRFFDCTPGEYQRQCRVAKAAALLRDPRASIADVAFTTGFADQSHLCRTFRRHMGVSPAKFRGSPPHEV